MNDSENYVVCGRDIAELKPTVELRFIVRFVPIAGRADISEGRQVLQQKWTASARMPDGGLWEEHRWRDVPTVNQ